MGARSRRDVPLDAAATESSRDGRESADCFSDGRESADSFNDRRESPDPFNDRREAVTEELLILGSTPRQDKSESIGSSLGYG